MLRALFSLLSNSVLLTSTLFVHEFNDVKIGWELSDAIGNSWTGRSAAPVMESADFMYLNAIGSGRKRRHQLRDSDVLFGLAKIYPKLGDNYCARELSFN